MSKKIIIDLQGGDNGPGELLKGALLAAGQHPELSFGVAGLKVRELADSLIAGDKDLEETFRNRFEILDAEEEIRTDEPAMCIFKGRDTSSMAVSLSRLKTDTDAAGLLCAGNTGALMVGSIFRLGLQEGLKTPALSTLLPNMKGGMTTLVDCGANVNIEAVNLKDFALLGSDFAKKMFDLESPSVALLNVGREAGKGNPLTVEAYGLLKELGDTGAIHFIGNAEGYDIIAGYADVIVCDGFAGNIALKLTEAVGKCALGIVESYRKDSSDSPALEEISGKLKELFVLNERGGATFLGTKKPVIKMHGCATADTVVSCVEQLLKIQ